MNAMSEVGSGWEEPHAFHRICIRHLASNVNTTYRNVKVKNLFGSTAMQFQEKKFDIGFARLGEMDRDAQHYVADVGIEKWSICHDGGHRYGILTTNLAEAFNNVLKGARFLPITALVQCIFFRVNAYFVERREEARKRLLQGQHYSSKITHLLEENCKKGAYHKVVSFEHVGGLYQVTTRRGSRNVSRGSHLHTVDLSKRTCTCNKFQTYKYPCSHVYAVCKKMKLNASQFVEISYTTREHLASYASKFQPLKDEAYWGHYNGPRIVCDELKRRGKGSMEYRLQPGPVNPEVLTQQETHRSKAIWDGDDKGSLRWASFRIGWLTENFSGLPEQANEQALHQYVRAYLLILMATVMFPDKSGNDIQVVYLPLLRDLNAIDDFSWGSAVLATLYLTGPENPPLIQGPYPLGSQHQLRVDSLGRRWLSVHRRRLQGTTITTLLGYRDALDNMRPDQFVWQPYPQAIFSFLPEACYNDSAYLAMWFRRYQFRFLGVEDNIDMGYNDPYMVWYRDRTRRFISPTFQQAYQAPLGATAYLAHGFAEVHRTCNTEIQAMPQEVPPHYRNIMSNIRDNTSQSLEHVGYSHLLQQLHQPTQETQVEEQHEDRRDGSTMQESTAEDDETLQVFRRRSRHTNTSMSPINEQGTPEPSKAKKIWSRLRGKKKT
ncbi:hypothetical protein KSS87_001175 [Heliosperma pusillum]|nr:hypothetical protein KSS87_001175 [Heliosperma pusillum]